MRGEHRRELVARAGDEVDDARRNVRGLHHLGPVRDNPRQMLRRHEHDTVAHRDGRREQRDHSQQRPVVGRDLADHADRFVQRHHHHIAGWLMDTAFEFVGCGGEGKEAFDAGLHFEARALFSGKGRKRGDQSICLGLGVLGQEIQDLGAAMGRLALPARRLSRRFDRVADVLAVALRRRGPGRATTFHARAVAAIGAGLCAADIELGGAVDGIGRARRRRACGGRNLSRGNGRIEGQIFDQAFAPAFSAEARFLHAAETAGRVEGIRAIHPDHAGLELGRDFERQANRFAPQRSRQAIAGVIRQLDGFGGRAEGLHHQHRAEDFVDDDFARGSHAGDKGGWVVATALASAQRAEIGLHDLRATGPRALDEAADALPLRAVDQRAHVDGFVQRIADAQAGHARAQLGQETLGAAFVHQEARAGAADLALVEPDAVDDALNRRIEIGVGKNDEG